MRRIARTFVTLGAAALAASSAMGQAPQPRRTAPARAADPAPAARRPMNAPVPNPAEMNLLLEQWAKQNGTLKSLTVGFVRTDTSKVWGKEEYVGNAYLQSPNLACLHFKKADKSNPKPVDHERIVCTGQEVRQYDFKTQQIFVFPLDRDQRKRAIQEGPLPFLFNLNAQEAKLRYEMTKMDEDKDNYLIGIAPRLPKDQEVFSQAYIQLNKRSFLPDRLLLVLPDGKDTQDYKFTQVAPNGQINPLFFQGLSIKGWKVVVNPGPVVPAQAGAGPRQPPQGRPQVAPRAAGAGRRPAQ